MGKIASGLMCNSRDKADNTAVRREVYSIEM
jgi:hypothetical protein